MKVLASIGILTCVLFFKAYSMEGSGKEMQSEKSCLQMEVLRGRDGRDGRDGVSGPPGEKGEPGFQGKSGTPGLPGPRGSVGGKGDRGNQGQQGTAGNPGPQGPQGLQGHIGPKGDRGSQGVMGSRGQQGPPGRCTQTYVRWGRTTCPGNISTELVYSGRAGGTHYVETGGGTNYLCMPNDPDYLQYDNAVQGETYVHGVEYHPVRGQPFYTQQLNVIDHNVPCAVCMAVSRCSMIMIPAKTQCPSSWTTEYVGYLMSAHKDYLLPTTYECVDKDPESVPGLNATGWSQGGGILNHVEASCNGMKCPPYVAGRELTCVVCTR